MVALDKLSSEQWDNLSILSIINGFPLQDVHVVTTRSHYLDLIYLEATEMSLNAGHSLNAFAIVEAAKLVRNSGNIFVRESVEISSTNITVYVDTDQIDEDAVTHALQLLSEAFEHLTGESGTVNFGQPLEYDLGEPLLALH